MSPNNYHKLFFDASITSNEDTYSAFIDAAIAQEGFRADEIIGVGERGTNNIADLYIVTRDAVVLASRAGFINKRIEVRRIGATSKVQDLRGTQEGFKGVDVTITATDSRGDVVFKIVWGLGGPDWVEPLIMRQREHLFRVIAEAMDRVAEAPARPSVTAASSKSGALMDWAAEVVRAAGVEVTDARVEEHANMAAGGIRMFVFLKMGARYGIDDLNRFYPNGDMPQGTPLETFDDLYGHVVARTGDANAVDRGIDASLAEAWPVYVNGCREQYS